MRKPKDPRELAVAMTSRSQCAVRVGAVLADGWGTHAWGQNHQGFDGLGCHAERECIRRANKARLAGSVMYVAAVRKRNNRSVTAKPCPECEKLLAKYNIHAVWRAKDGKWYA